MDQSSKHSPRSEPALDVDLEAAEIFDEMADEAVTFEGDRTDVTPDVDVVFAPDVVERSDLAIVLRPDAFPAEAAVLIAVAEEEGAPPEILARLGQLPGGEYHTVGEVWEALGGPVEHRGVEAPAPSSAAEERPERTDREVDDDDELYDDAIEAELDELDGQELELEAIAGDDLAELQADVEAGFEEGLAELEDALDALDGASEADERARPPKATVASTPADGARDDDRSPPRHAALAPVARAATLPLRITARLLRGYAAALDRLADSVPGARSGR